MRDPLGNQLLELMREINARSIPRMFFNPGKIFAMGPSRDGHQHTIDNQLRENFTRPLDFLSAGARFCVSKTVVYHRPSRVQVQRLRGFLNQSGIMCPMFIRDT